MTNASALTAYDRLVQSGDINLDVKQRAVLEVLDDLRVRLIARRPWTGGRRGLLRRQRWETPERGAYIWGGVGRGKTFLMDLFVNAMPEAMVVRLHFHRFMNQVHARLTALQGTENPLEVIADEFARHARVLCFDECFVTDITDAMVLGTLFDALFRRGVSLVTTSNIPPDALYQDGLQRDRFLPAIALIQTHCHVIHLESGTDYRLRTLEHATLYHSPFDGDALDAIWTFVRAMAPEATQSHAPSLQLNRRELPVRFLAEDVVWFDFAVLCGMGRAVADYIELARMFHTAVITEVPCLSTAGDDQTRRFLHLVDELYDRSVNVVIGASVPLDALYTSGKLAFEMERCRSRLLEMQSVEYLERPHQPE